jgi:hypothetical protein
VAGATVTAMNNGKVWTTRTGDDGSYLLKEMPPGKYSVTVTKDGFQPAKLLPHNPTIELPEVPAGGCAIVPATFQTSATISGKVFTSSGRPASGVRIQLGEVRPEGEARVIPETWTSSAPDGSFTVKNVPVGRVVIGANINSSPDSDAPFDTVYAPGAPSVGLARVFSVKADETVGGVTLQLPSPLPFATLFVDVLWPDGSPATQGARATADWKGHRSDFERAAKNSNRVLLHLALGREYEISADWLSDANGRFSFVEGAEKKLVTFDHNGQTVELRLRGMPSK